MNIRRLLFTALTAAAFGGLVSDRAGYAQGIGGIFGGSNSGDNRGAEGDQDGHLFDGISRSNSSSVRPSRMTVAELRQSRALYRANQRVARMEYNLWMQRQPLRPNWSAVPMMNSRYPGRRVYVPVYIRSR
jgi:hypothetical protein